MVPRRHARIRCGAVRPARRPQRPPSPRPVSGNGRRDRVTITAPLPQGEYREAAPENTPARLIRAVRQRETATTPAAARAIGPAHWEKRAPRDDRKAAPARTTVAVDVGKRVGEMEADRNQTRTGNQQEQPRRDRSRRRVALEREHRHAGPPGHPREGGPDATRGRRRDRRRARAHRIRASRR